MTPATVVLDSLLTCPLCGHRTLEEMPVNACLFFHECDRCHAVFRPRPGDCCVFCSYGSVKCPPEQLNGPCGNPNSKGRSCRPRQEYVQ